MIWEYQFTIFESKIFRSRFATDCVVNGKQNMNEKIQLEMNFWIFFPENISMIFKKNCWKKNLKSGFRKKKKWVPNFFTLSDRKGKRVFGSQFEKLCVQRHILQLHIDSNECLHQAVKKALSRRFFECLKIDGCRRKIEVWVLIRKIVFKIVEVCIINGVFKIMNFN